MESALVHALGLEYQPVALSLSDEAPRGARTPPKGRTCVMRFRAAAARGETVALEKDTVSCRGGLIGLGFTGDISHMPGGEEGFYRFLSTGNRPHLKELGLAEAGMSEDFLDGERYLKTPELVKLFVEGLPAVEIEERFVVLRPLSPVGPGEDPLSARLCVNALLGDRYLTFSVPWRFFREMERDVPGSFLERTTWRKLMALRKKKR